ncbi:hypothetical protein IPA_05035 [Ignicoccus pacificus DSM 13166]|uniref:Alpha-galactosidase NEW3 domain-containing protein n=1 Tax=Ignicoccus pacificus DSM 13166 TaxID=940294 RepID=A0A977KBA4_9CREN|nr:hypothetical protein IPA_05035 [Ignicoccus pacificus DSM 13166]
MKRWIILMVLLGIVLAQPITTLNIEVQAQKPLVYGERVPMRIKVCNVGVMNFLGVALQYEVRGGIIEGGTTYSLGFLGRGACKEMTLNVIPISSNLKLKILAMVNTNIGTKSVSMKGDYFFEWFVKSPKLLASVKSVDLLSGKLELSIKNVGNMVASNITLYASSDNCQVRPAVTNIGTIKPGSAKVVNLILRAPEGIKSCLIRATLTDGISNWTSKITIQIRKPQVNIEIGNVITICYSGKTSVNGTLTLSAQNALIAPAVSNVSLRRGCVKVPYTLISPSTPLRIIATLNIGSFTYIVKRDIKALPLSITTNVTTLAIGSKNLIRLRIGSDYSFKKAIMKMEPSVGSLNVSSLVVNSNSTVWISWSIPTKKIEGAYLHVNVLGNEIKIPFVLIKQEPPINLEYSPKTLLEGSNTKLKLCVVNNWTRSLKSVTLETNATQPVISSYLGNIPPKSKKCVDVIASVPWGMRTYKIYVILNSEGYTKKYLLDIPMMQNPNVAVLKVTINPMSLKPGSSYTTLIVKNEGKGWARNVVVSVSSPDLVYPTSKVPLGDIGPGKAKMIQLQFTVPPDINKEKCKISIDYCSGTAVGPCEPKRFETQVNIPVEPYVPPTLQITSSKLTLRSGNVTEITLKITNVGNDVAIAPELTIGSSKIIGVVGETTFVLNNIKPKDSVTVKLQVNVQPVNKRTAASLSYSLRYGDPWGKTYNNRGSLTFTILPMKRADVVVHVLSNTLIKGDNRVLLVRVRNVGNSIAKNITLTAYASGVVIKDPTLRIGTLMPGQAITWRLVYSIPTSSLINSVQLSVTVNYLSNGQSEVNTFSFPMKVIMGPQMEITDVTVTPQKVIAGKALSVSVVLVNSGDAPAYNVHVSVQLPVQLTAIGPTRVFLGNIRQQNSVPVAFVLKPKEGTAPGTYVAKIVASYNFNGARYSVETPVTIIVTSPSSQYVSMFERYKLYAAIGGAALALIVIVVLIKRRRKSGEVITEE